MNILLETYHRLWTEKKPLYLRQFYADFKMNHPIMGIVGARGVGKTTFLLHFLRENYADSNKALYVSADHLYFAQNSLLSLADIFHKEYAGKIICIDEIHRYRNWNQELKNIYDSYPKLKIIFSGSSSLSLIKGKYDLSRRASLKTMPGFSFREFLEFKLKQSLPLFSLEDLVKDSAKISQQLSKIPKLLGYLKEYLQHGYYPMFTEIADKQTYQESLISIIDKIIFEDISSFYSLKTKNLNAFRRLIYFIATSAPGTLNINKLAKSIQKDHTTISEYLEMLRESGLLKYLLIDKRGHSLIRNAEKIYLNDTNLLFAINDSLQKETDIGLVREIFIINQLENADYKAYYTKQADLKCDDHIFEIGGQGKSEQKIKNQSNSFLIKDNILVGTPKTIPLYLFGFLY